MIVLVAFQAREQVEHFPKQELTCTCMTLSFVHQSYYHNYIHVMAQFSQSSFQVLPASKAGRLQKRSQDDASIVRKSSAACTGFVGVLWCN